MTQLPNNIKTLLDNFLEGNTTHEEEQALARFFRTHEVSEEWQAVKTMFAYFDSGMPESETPVEWLPKPKERPVRTTLHTRSNMFYRGIAATLLALFALSVTLWFYVQPKEETSPPIARNSVKTTERTTPAPITAEPTQPIHTVVAEQKHTNTVVKSKPHHTDRDKMELDSLCRAPEEQARKQLIATLNQQAEGEQELEEQLLINHILAAAVQGLCNDTHNKNHTNTQQHEIIDL